MLAELDCLLSLAACARDFELVRPTMTEDNLPNNLVIQYPPTHLGVPRGTLLKHLSLRLGAH